MATDRQPPIAHIGILSIGDMGAGIARRLVAEGFAVYTNGEGRSQDTIQRARVANVHLLPSDADLVARCDALLSVVPPRDAEPTARRVVDALTNAGSASARASPLYFAELNAVSPASARAIAALFAPLESAGAARFVDGAIIGGPPAKKTTTGEREDWYLPLVPTSGPYALADAPGYGPPLARALNERRLTDPSSRVVVGAASGLKMCFASLTKGFAALAVQSFASAAKLGVTPDLRAALEAVAPAQLTRAEGALTGLPPKAYRWVREMEEIAATHREEGGFGPGDGGELFLGAAGVFRVVAEDTVLGLEKVGERKRGRTAEDVAAAVVEGLEKKRKRGEDP